jgi:hypothetical protein
LYDRNYINHCENDTGYNQQYNKSIFIKSLFYFIDKHNEKLTRENKPGGEKVNKFTTDFFETISRIVLEIKIDYFYFKSQIYPQLNSIFEDYARENNYRVPFDIKKTIIVHLRLDDGRGFPDYDGLHCAHHFRSSNHTPKYLCKNVYYNFLLRFSSTKSAILLRSIQKTNFSKRFRDCG